MHGFELLESPQLVGGCCIVGRERKNEAVADAARSRPYGNYPVFRGFVFVRGNMGGCLFVLNDCSGTLIAAMGHLPSSSGE